MGREGVRSRSRVSQSGQESSGKGGHDGDSGESVGEGPAAAARGARGEKGAREGKRSKAAAQKREEKHLAELGEEGPQALGILGGDRELTAHHICSPVSGGVRIARKRKRPVPRHEGRASPSCVRPTARSGPAFAPPPGGENLSLWAVLETPMMLILNGPSASFQASLPSGQRARGSGNRWGSPRAGCRGRP